MRIFREFEEAQKEEEQQRLLLTDFQSPNTISLRTSAHEVPAILRLLLGLKRVLLI